MESALVHMAEALRQLINISEEELAGMLQFATVAQYARKSIISPAGLMLDHYVFIHKGLCRLCLTDASGQDHTTYFALEGQFICDYASIINQFKSNYSLQALEDVTVVLVKKESINWGLAHLVEGQILARKIAEYYFTYLDRFIINQYILEPAERYNQLNQVFPNIVNRVPQHMLASYLGITPVHLSRLRAQTLKKAQKS